jgi:hypothetical protein
MYKQNSMGMMFVVRFGEASDDGVGYAINFGADDYLVVLMADLI